MAPIRNPRVAAALLQLIRGNPRIAAQPIRPELFQRLNEMPEDAAVAAIERVRRDMAGAIVRDFCGFFLERLRPPKPAPKPAPQPAPQPVRPPRIDRESVKFPPRPKRRVDPSLVCAPVSAAPGGGWISNGDQNCFNVNPECPCMARRRRPIDVQRSRFTPRIFTETPGSTRIHTPNGWMTPLADYSGLRSCRKGTPVVGTVTTPSGYTYEFTPRTPAMTPMHTPSMTPMHTPSALTPMRSAATPVHPGAATPMFPGAASPK